MDYVIATTIQIVTVRAYPLLLQQRQPQQQQLLPRQRQQHQLRAFKLIAVVGVDTMTSLCVIAIVLLFTPKHPILSYFGMHL